MKPFLQGAGTGAGLLILTALIMPLAFRLFDCYLNWVHGLNICGLVHG